MKKLIVFFSASGITRQRAEELKAKTDSDIYEIIPESVYTNADRDWRNKKSRSSVEMQDKTSRPEIKGELPDVSGYDVIYIGFPIWWGVAPRIVNTFIESEDLRGKTIVVFATSGGSGSGHAVEDLKRNYPELSFKDGGLLNGRVDGDIL